MKFYWMCIALPLIVIFSSCTWETKPQKGSLELTIKLDGQIDHSGITVLLYANHAKLFTNTIPVSHPRLSTIDTKTLFDHRTFRPLKQMLTNIEGKVHINDIANDSYTVCILKEGWGIRYLYDVFVEGESLITEEIILYPEQEINQAITDDFDFEANKTYRIESTIISTSNALLRFHAGTNIIMGSSGNLNIMGTVDCPSDYTGFARVTSADKIYQAESDFLKQGCVRVNSSSASEKFQNMVFSYLYDGLMIYKRDFEIRKNVFYGSTYACQILNTSQIQIEDNFFFSNKNNQGAALYGYSVDGLYVNKNYFTANWYSVLLELTTKSFILDNYFDSSKFEIYTNWESVIDVQNNLFLGNGTGVVNAGRCDVNIKYNEFDKDICIGTVFNHSQAGTSTFGFTTANYNNFKFKVRSVDSWAMYANGGDPLIMNFENNYWGTSNKNEIQDSIYDYYSSPPSPYPHLNWAIIDFVPFRSAKILNVGIR